MRPELVRPSYPFLGIGIAFSNRFETLSPNTQKCRGCRQATILDFQLPNNKRGSARSDDTAVGVRNLYELVNEPPLALHRGTERLIGTVSTAVLRCRMNSGCPGYVGGSLRPRVIQGLMRPAVQNYIS